MSDGYSKITPDAQAELGAFRDHLTNHEAGAPDCRFCDAREKQWGRRSKLSLAPARATTTQETTE